MKQKNSILAVAAIALVLYSLIVFLVPFYRGPVFYLSYVFTVIAIAAQLLFVHMAFNTGTSARSRFYGYPIFRIGIIYMVIQLVLSLIFMALGKLAIRLWLPTLLYLLLLGIAAIGLITNDNVRDTVVMVEERQAENTANIRALRRSAEVLASHDSDFADLAEALRYADPVTTNASEPYERNLADLMDQAFDCTDPDAKAQLHTDLLELLKQRNAVCKSSKTR